MASEYLKWKYRDVQPDRPLELTPAQKRKNWLYYHKWHIALGGVLAAALVSIGWHALGIGEIRPDYQVAYVGSDALPEDTAAALEAGFAALGEDLNGDGRTVVRVVQYLTANADPELAYSAAALLTGDLVDCESYFFLLEDPAGFQRNYQALCRLDGSLPEDGERVPAYLAWTDCPVLAGMDLGEYSDTLLGETVSGSSDALVSGLYLGRRGFWTEKSVPHPEGCETLWNRLTEGAVS